MKNWWKAAVVAALVIAVAVIVIGKNKDSEKPKVTPEPQVTATQRAEPPAPPESEQRMAKEDRAATKPVKEEAKKGSAPLVLKTAQNAPTKTEEKPAPKVEKRLPRIVDLGASKCIPCKMMVPVLEELTAEQKGKLVVEFIDVWKNQAEGEKYGIRSIPTQIFFDENGKEFFRHEGFFAKEDIIAKFKEQGIDL
jgi:thioredoxin 1